MAVIAVIGPKGSQGVSATTLALGLTWPNRAIVAECDPAGGDALAGYLAGTLDFPGGLGSLPVVHGRGRLEADLWQHMIDLDAPFNNRLLLPGIRYTGEAGGVAAIGDRLARLFADLGRAERAYDVFADCGRLAAANVPWPVLTSADVIVMVVRPDLPSVARAQAALLALREKFERESWNLHGLHLVVIGSQAQAREVSRELGVPVLGALPFDADTAARLTHGGKRPRAKDSLIKAAADLIPALRAAVGARAAAVTHV